MSSADEITTALADAPVALAVADLEGRLLFRSRRFNAAFGEAPKTLTGLAAGPDRAALAASIARLAGGAGAEITFEARASGRTWAVTVSLSRGPDGAPSRLTAAAIDQPAAGPSAGVDVPGPRRRDVIAANDAASVAVARALSSREEMLSLIFNHTSELLSLIGRGPEGEWRVLAINDAYLRALGGYGAPNAREQIVGRPLADVMRDVLGYPPDLVAPSLARYDEARRTRLPASFEQITTLPTERVYSEATIIPIPDAHGEVRHILWSGRDLTRRRQAELALAASEQQFRQLAENIREVFWIIEPGSRRALYVSPAYAEVWGRPTEPLADLSGDRVEGIHPDDRDAIDRMLAANERGTTAIAEYRVVRSDGSVRHVRDQGAPVLDERGRVTRVVGIAVDVTEEKIAAEDLRRSEERFHRMLQAGWDVIALSLDDGRFSFVGGNTAGIYGCTHAELAALDVISIVHPDDRARHAEFRRALLAAPGSRQRLEFRVRRKDGQYTWIEVAAVNLLHDPVVRGVLSNSRDVSARKRTEEDLSRLNAELEQRVAERTAELSLANAALERASRAKDEFLAAMSHELRTPLNAVLGLSEALDEGVYGPLDDKQHRALRRIDESGRHLLSLISDILDLSKIEAGRMPLALADVAVDDVCRASIRMVQEAAHRKSQRVALAVDVGFATLRADERRLTQILVNLLSNAVKFTPDGGALGLRVNVDEANDAVRFSVWDTGIGIGIEEQARLFQPFVQLDSSLARRHVGAGLGLSLVRKLVDLHGGSVALESAAGQGARFTVTLPRDASAALRRSRAGPRARGGAAPGAARRRRRGQRGHLLRLPGGARLRGHGGAQRP